MPRLTRKDALSISVFIGLALITSVLVVVGSVVGAVVSMVVLIAAIGTVSRLEFAASRSDRQADAREARSLRKAIEQIRGDSSALRSAIRGVRVEQQRASAAAARPRSSDLAADVVALRAELRGMRVAQQLLSQAVAATKADVLASLGSTDELRSAIDELRTDGARSDRQARVREASLLNEAQALTQLLTRYTPTAPLPDVAGWALSPKGLVYVLDVIDEHDVQLVVECGSGTSTLWAASAMKRKGSGRVIALEHDERYAQKTRATLAAHGLSDWADVVECPLTAVETPRGEFQWYDLTDVAFPGEIDLLLVDGPPGATGPHARYPALPLLRSHLNTICTIVVDDADRIDEKEAISFWIDEGLATATETAPGRGIEVLTAV